jgi:small-conductance mechanosensitive channel
VIDGVTLFRLRGISSYPAKLRASIIEERIRAVARDEAISPDSLRVIDEDTDISRVMAGDQFVLGVADADAEFEGVTRKVLLEIYTVHVAQAIRSYRENRTWPVLIRNSLFAAGALAIFAFLLVSIIWTFRRLRIFLEKRYKSKVRDVQIQSFQILEANELWKGIRATINAVQALLILFLIFTCLNYVFSLYPWTRGFATEVLDVVLDPLTTIGWGLVEFLPNLVFLVILFLVTRYALKLFKLFFSAIERRRIKLSGFEREWAWPTYRIVRLVAIIFAIVVAYPYIPGSESAAFKGITILLGVMFSLGSSSIIGNVIAGYTMTYRRAFRLGDRIKVGDMVGDVIEMRVLETHLRSLKNEEIVVPNNVMLNSHVVNYSSLARDKGLILHTTVGIGYDVPWRQVEAMLLLAAERTPNLLRDPPPFVLQTEMQDFCVRYELNVYCDRASEMARLYTLLHQNILDVFNEYEIPIMTPAYVSDTAEPKMVPKDVWFAPPAKLPSEPLQRASKKQKEA